MSGARDREGGGSGYASSVATTGAPAAGRTRVASSDEGTIAVATVPVGTPSLRRSSPPSAGRSRGSLASAAVAVAASTAGASLRSDSIGGGGASR